MKRSGEISQKILLLITFILISFISLSPEIRGKSTNTMKTKSILILVLMLITLSIATLSCKKDGAATEEEANSVQPIPQGPIGTTNGIFSVSNTEKVYFSKGNLQYQASTNTWRFAKHQWNFVGDIDFGNVYCNGIKCSNSLIASDYSGWIDLFGWGTSGYNHGAVCYQPWSTSTVSRNYFAYGNDDYNLYDQTGFADWGKNRISNDDSHQWRTLTIEEWNYILNARNTSSGIRYAKAKVNDVHGVIIIPDNWSSSTYHLNATNSATATYASNIISKSIWTSILEANGAVFLPAGSIRRGTEIEDVGILKGYYWSSSNYYGPENIKSTIASNIEFNDYDFYVGNDWLKSKDNGLSVRLVCNAN